MVILRLRNMTAIDATGLHALEDVLRSRLRQIRQDAAAVRRPRSAGAICSNKADFIEHIGRENVLPHVQAALERARQINSAFGGVGQEMADDFERTSL